MADLRCEYLRNPLGIDEPRPRLSWLLHTRRRGARQVAWRVRVASSLERLQRDDADLWDSGCVEDNHTSQIVYDGTPLPSRTVCHWDVTIWDELDAAVTSEPALWTMGLVGPGDWQASWITHDPEIIRRDPDAVEGTATEPGTPPLFRKEFDLPDKVHSATLYATARGLIDVELNGHAVTDDVFVPEWTDYYKRLHYRTFDVTNLVQNGGNAVGAMLGDGWWSGYVGWQETRGRYGTLENSLLLQLEVELADGRRVVVCTDSTWRCETGPILQSDFMMGESYDARRERTGWAQPGFDDDAWLSAVEVAPPKVRTPYFAFSPNEDHESDQPLPLVAQRSEPVRVVERIRPVSVMEVAPKTFVYDLGQNISGWVEIRVFGKPGTRVELRHAERLNPDGTIYTENLRRAKATDSYILGGNGPETRWPRFTFHGFQYFEITGLDEPPTLDDVCGCVVMSATPPAGTFKCSHEGVNRLWMNALWGQKGNFLTVPTDCPQRDERLGWMGDAQVFLRTATYNMDVAAFMTKWSADVRDSQDEAGVFPDTAPRLREGDNFVGLDGLGGAAGWADAGVIVPWTLWRVYGDERIVERSWDSMVAWLDHIERTNPDGIRSEELGNNYGDWLCIPADTTFRTHSEMKTLLATAYWADDARKMAQMAFVLSKPEAEARFTEMFRRVRQRFQDKWLLEDGRLAVETQTAYLLALAFDLLPANAREGATANLVENIRDNNWSLSTGFIGISHLNPTLTLAGRADVAYRLLLNEHYPSWLYPVAHGATTIWERWDGWTEENGFFNPLMNSFNHYSLGSVGEWLYRHVAGIELAPEVPAYQRFVLKPHIDERLQSAEAAYVSINGEIRSRWERSEQGLSLHATIPANTRARVCVPCHDPRSVLESDGPAAEAAGVQFIEHTDGYAVFDVAAGEYRFTVV